MDAGTADIVSRRSVERVYFPDEPQYTRFFVKKYQRRPPLINRSFHLRMHLVDAVVHQFLLRPSSKPKVIVCLECGSNTLPWRSIHRNKAQSQGVKFVDVDSPEIIKAKCEIVNQTRELREVLTSLELHSDSHTILSSDQYFQVACDLCQLQILGEALSTITNVPESEFLFILETSSTRLKAEAADALISWASTLGDAEFCLLGQILLDERSSSAQKPSEPEAKGQNFIRYSTTSNQWQRFRDLGWPGIEIWTLWEAWSDRRFMSSDQRRELDGIEAFDEWEEFLHYANHHFILRARTGTLAPEACESRKSSPTCASTQILTTAIALNFSPSSAPKSTSPRRFGAPMTIKSILGEQFVANAFGQGSNGHLRSYDLYSRDVDPENPSPAIVSQGGPCARSFFTLTDLGDHGYLLAGGRTSPSAPFNDCWVFKKDANQWVKTHSLPLPLFRHMAERLGSSQLVLLTGGRSGPSTVHSDFLLYHPNTGWARCLVKGGLRPPALFGGLLLCTTTFPTRHSQFRGILAGGMTDDVLVSGNVYNWVLDVSNVTEPTIDFTPTASHSPIRILARYGAISTRVDGWTIVAGGFTSGGCVLQSDEIVRFRAYGEDNEILERLDYTAKLGLDTPRPIFTGASIKSTDDGKVILIGGGLSYTSTDTVWSRGIYSFDARRLPSNVDTAPGESSWGYQRTLTITNEALIAPREPNMLPGGLSSAVTIPRLTLESAEQFLSILQGGQPVVFEGLDLGSCLRQWSMPYLAEHVGPERKVVVHDAISQAMDFLAKNFKYSTQTFQEFAHGVEAGKKLYLRALSADNPSDAPARLDTDFPTISKDFVLPPQLAFVQDRLFSSVLRVSGPVNMWLHYDVLANVYCQVKGTKRFYLFPPSDVTHLGFAPGASSSSIDVFSSLASPCLSQCHPYETVLGPGDVLFLPQLWLHTATPVSSRSIAVNVFFRDLTKGYSSGRDVYGNRDLSAYEKARHDVSRISKSFKDLPRDTRQFYLSRIADELLQVATE